MIWSSCQLSVGLSERDRVGERREGYRLPDVKIIVPVQPGRDVVLGHLGQIVVNLEPFSVNEDRLYVRADADSMYRVLYNLIEKIYETLYTADAYDEFNIMKYLLAEHILAGHLKTVSVAAPSSEANVRADVTAIKATSNKMKFMTGDYNIAGVKTAVATALNVYDILNAGKFVMSVDAAKKIEEVFA